MAIKNYNENTGKYESADMKSGFASTPNTGTENSPTGYNINNDPTRTVGDHAAPNVDYYVPRGENASDKYLEKYQAMIDKLPGLFSGGTGVNPNVVEQQSVEDVGWSEDYQDFTGALADNMLASLDPGNNPFSVEDRNAQAGDINRQFQQQEEQLANQAASEGWLNTPRYDKAVRELKFNNLLATQQNRVQYNQVAASWDLENKAIVTDFYQKWTSAEAKNREIKLNEGKINADFAWAASKERTRIAAANASAARSARLQAFNMELGLTDKMYSIEVAERDYNDAANWDRFAAATNIWSLEKGIEQSEAEMEWQKQQQQAHNNTLLGFLGF